MPAKSKADSELTELLTKLYTMQEDVGVKEKTSPDEKKQKAENVATMGTGRKAQQKGSRFLALKGSIVNHVKSILSNIEEAKARESDGFGGDNQTQLIRLQNDIREEIRQSQEEWDEMKAIYDKEARKKRSKFTPEELELQEQLVLQLLVKIEGVKNANTNAFASDNAGEDDAAAALIGVTQFDRELLLYFLFIFSAFLFVFYSLLFIIFSVSSFFRRRRQGMGRRRGRCQADGGPAIETPGPRGEGQGL